MNKPEMNEKKEKVLEHNNNGHIQVTDTDSRTNVQNPVDDKAVTKRCPDYVGTAALGLKMGVIVPGCNLKEMIAEVLEQCHKDFLLDDGDVVCITESILARAQNNYVSLDQVAREVKRALHIDETGRIGVVFPILSRNRFSMILQGIAKAVPKGEVIIQLSYPADEVGNELIPPDVAASLEESLKVLEKGEIKYGRYRDPDVITEADLQDQVFLHPVTKVDYIKLYREAVESQGAAATIILANNPAKIAAYNPEGVIAADIHNRLRTSQAISKVISNTITLTELCAGPSGDEIAREREEGWEREEGCSEWGLLGSNMSSGGRLKLAPRNAKQFAEEIKKMVIEKLNRDVEVVVYGDGAYKDPSTGIYELADPMAAFGATGGVYGRFREGIKYKYIADTAIAAGKTTKEVEDILESTKRNSGQTSDQSKIESEGTTPRRMEDLLASLADLVSGSADAGTPIVLVKGFLKPSS